VLTLESILATPMPPRGSGIPRDHAGRRTSRSTRTTVPGAPIHAVIGVWHRGADTFYVRRSMDMTNYPGVWSLPSIKYDPASPWDAADLDEATWFFHRLSMQRLGGAAVTVERFLYEDTSDMNPMGVDVTLRLYEITIGEGIRLEPSYYVESAWMMPEVYERESAGQPCGQCLRMWSDWAWLHGITDRPFVPTPAA
jgi:hypothetical protein